MTIKQIIDQIKIGPNDITIYKGAVESTLRWFELQMGIVLPDDFKELYRFSDGFESAEDAFRILSLDEIFDNRNQKYRSGLPGKRFYFAEYMQYSDLWSVEMGESQGDGYAIFCTAKNDEKVVMTHSLADFLECFLAGGVFENNGLYAWRDAIANNHS
ncbi:MAG: SMI1/KNR4 family protein [Hymenobacter sp.]|nr:MAG: SMI1/KNR4 family protein [Hymenobacter sp.]